MKFYQLLGVTNEEDSKKIKSILGLMQYYNNGLSSKSIEGYFSKILKQDEDAIKYIDLIKSDTVFESKLLNKTFKTKTLKLLKDYGFFINHTKEDIYLVADEYYEALLDSDEKIFTYLNSGVKFLKTLVGSNKNLPKHRLISEIFKIKSKKLSKDILDEFYEFYEALYPIKKIFTKTVNLYEIEEWLVRRNDELYPSAPWKVEENMFSEFFRLAPNIFDKGYIFHTKLNYDHILVMIPDVYDQVLNYIDVKKDKQKKEILNNLEQYSDIKINTKFSELSHLEPNLLFRLFSFSKACIANELLTFNKKDLEPKISDIKKITKFLSPWTSVDKLQAGSPAFEVTCVLIKELIKFSHSRIAQSKTFQEQLGELFSFKKFGVHLQIIADLSDKLPKNVWVSCEQLFDLYKLEVKSSPNYSLVLLSKEVFIKGLIYLQSFFSFVDLAFENEIEKSVKGKFLTLPKAVRFLKGKEYLLKKEFLEDIKKNYSESNEKIKISNNLEVILPLNLNLNKTSALAEIFEIKNLHTLSISEKHICNLVKHYKTKDEFLLALKENIVNDIPQIVERILDKIYKSREKIYLDTEFIYIYNTESIEKVLSLIPKKNYVINIDNRVLAFRYRPNLEKLREKLEKSNFIIEGLSSSKGYRSINF